VAKKIATRIAELEARLIEPPRRVCEECGAENGGSTIWETHTLDGKVLHKPHAPCPGCSKVRPAGAVRKIVICKPHAYGLECPTCGPPHPAIVERKKLLEEGGYR
jgi:hypothetical protein